MKKIIMTTGVGPKEELWQKVLDISGPRFQRYADRHGYDFKAVWYDDISRQRFPEFWNAERFIGKATEQPHRRDWIRWTGDRRMLAPNWLRYAAVQQLMNEYALIVYFDVDCIIADFETDIAEGFPYDKWIAGPINGPNPDDGAPGGAVWLTRTCEQSKQFWRRVWEGKRWTYHPLWTDGVDFVHLLGYTTMPPIRKVRRTEYDHAWHTISSEWSVYFREHPDIVGKCYHVAGGLDPNLKRIIMEDCIRVKGLE